jgi:hypothetical protein
MVLMEVRRMRSAGYAVAAALLAASLIGCHVETHKNGDSDNVKIGTPFGGLQVRTNDSSALENMGMTAYPGAQMVQKNGEKGDGAADVDMHFGGFRMRVKAVTYRTQDPPDKVEAFYRDDLKRYGDVLTCAGETPVGTPAKTMQGLTCHNEHEGHISVDDPKGKGNLELKTGSPQHQHIVAIEPDSGGTKFGLVVLDLPGHVAEDDR